MKWKNENIYIYMGFLMIKIWQICKHFSRALSWAQTSYFSRVKYFSVLMYVIMISKVLKSHMLSRCSNGTGLFFPFRHSVPSDFNDDGFWLRFDDLRQQRSFTEQSRSYYLWPTYIESPPEYISRKIEWNSNV